MCKHIWGYTVADGLQRIPVDRTVAQVLVRLQHPVNGSPILPCRVCGRTIEEVLEGE